MFQEIDLIYIFGPAVIIASIVMVILYFRIDNQPKNELSKVTAHFMVSIIAMGMLLIILWLSLPHPPALRHTEDILAIENKKELVSHLQQYNQAIIRTSEVLRWFLFIFIWWFLASLLGLLKAIKSYKELPGAHFNK